MKFVAAFSLLLLAVADAATKMCPLNPAGETSPVELTLEKYVLSHGLKDLPIEFHGIHPLVVRKPTPFGGTPKITVSRYSGNAPPSVEYDAEKEMVTIKTTACSAMTGGADSTSDATACFSKPSGFFSSLMMAGGAMAAVNENARPAAALLAAGAALTFMDTTNAHEAECMPVVQIVVEAPAAYRGAVETCDDKDDTAVPLFGRADETVSRLGCMSGLEAICADPQRQQWVTVA